VKSTQTALVVDDDPEIRKLISLYLQRAGFTVTSASDGRSAIKKLDEARPALLCLDLMLPESSGYDVCEHVLKSPTLRGMPILMISARTMPEDRAMAEELGVVKYLFKPFTQAQFLEGVREAMAGPAPHEDPP
jgi:two-component system chemotaxis response regulator CheY